MKISKRVRGVLQDLPWSSAKRSGTSPSPDASAPDGGSHLDLARESLRELVQDRRIPPEVREALAEDYHQVEAMLEKLEQGHIHIAAFGRVSVGKSATLTEQQIKDLVAYLMDPASPVNK